jgi:citrate lyase beta subunit
LDKLISKALNLLKEHPALNIIFDLEDAMINIENMSSEAQVKASARHQLKSHFEILAPYRERLHVRINSLNSPHREKDLTLIKEMKGSIDGIVFAKCESPDEIEALVRDQYLVSPMVETQKGLDNIEALVKMSNRSFRIGIADFHLNTKRKPIPFSPLEDDFFQKIIERFMNLSVKYGKEFTTPVYTRIADFEGYTQLLRYYLQLIPPGHPVGFTLLHPQQLQVYDQYQKWQWQEIKPFIKEIPLKEKFFLCIQIVETYQKREDRDLGVAQVKNRKDGQYASHHFTYDAIEFLENLKKTDPQKLGNIVQNQYSRKCHHSWCSC